MQRVESMSYTWGQFEVFGMHTNCTNYGHFVFVHVRFEAVIAVTLKNTHSSANVCCVLWYKVTDISQECTAHTFRVKWQAKQHASESSCGKL